MGLLAVSIAAVLLAQGIVCFHYHRQHETDKHNHYDNERDTNGDNRFDEIFRTYENDREPINGLLSRNKRVQKHNHGLPNQNSLLLLGDSGNKYYDSIDDHNDRYNHHHGHVHYNNLVDRNSEYESYNNLLGDSLQERQEILRNDNRKQRAQRYEDSEEYYNAVSEENNLNDRPHSDEELDRTEFISNSALKNALEAVILAHRSNEKLAKAVHAAKIARSAIHSKIALRNAAVVFALKAADLAQKSNEKLEAALRSRGLSNRSGGDTPNDADKASIEAALEQTRSAKNDNAQLTRALESSAGNTKDFNSVAISHAVNAARHAHESNAVIGEAIRSVDDARSGRNGDSSAASQNAVSAAAQAARLSEQSKNDLETASNAANNAAQKNIS